MAAAPTPEHAMESAVPTDVAPPGVSQPPPAVAAEPQLLQGTLTGFSLYLRACSHFGSSSGSVPLFHFEVGIPEP